MPAVELRDLHRPLRAVGAAQHVERRRCCSVPLLDAADGEAADVVVVVEVVGLELRRHRRVDERARAASSTMRSNSGRRSVARLRRGRSVGDAGARVGVDDREVELLFGGVEVDEQVVDLVEHLGDARVGRGRSC